MRLLISYPSKIQKNTKVHCLRQEWYKIPSQRKTEAFNSDSKDEEPTPGCSDVKYDKCMYSALENIMMEQHGCVVPYIISDKV